MNHSDPSNHDPNHHDPVEASGPSGGGSGPSDMGEQVREILARVGGQLDLLRSIQHDHDEQLATIEERERRLVEGEQSLAAHQRGLAGRQELLEQEQAALTQQREHVDSNRDDSGRRLDELQAELETDRRAIEHERGELKSARGALAEERSTIDAQRTALEEERQALAHDREWLEGERRAWSEEHQQFQGTSEAKLREFEEREQTVLALEQELVAREARLAEERQATDAACGERTAELAEEVTSLRRQLTEGEHAPPATDSNEAELDQARGQVEQLTEHCAKLESAIIASRDQADTATSEAMELTQDVEGERDTALAALAEARSVIERLERERDEAIARAGEGPARDGQDATARPGVLDAEAMNDLRFKARRLATVATHLRRRQERLKRLRHDVRRRRTETTPAVTPPVPTAPVAPAGLDAGSREEHAARMRRLDKQRQEVVERRAQLAESERRMMRRWARPRSVGTVVWLMVLVSLSAGASWLLADHFFPAVVSASATLEAKGRQIGPLPEDEATQWQIWHAELIGDDRFRSGLAERMDRRRLEEYATAGAVAARLDEDLTIDATDPARLVFTLAGRDGDELREFLDLVAGMVATESTRQLKNRPNTAWAVVKGERVEHGRICYSTMNAVAIDDQRLMYAGPIFGVVLLVVLVIVGFIYRHLMGMKREFDGDGAVFSDEPVDPAAYS